MHTLLFLDPGHFHAALTLRVPHPRVSDEVVVYAPDGPELRDFLGLIERFNRRAEHPTRWRPVVITGADPLARLVNDRRGDVVVLAGRNGGKARTIRTLHAAGFHVLADKPWLTQRDDLDHLGASLSGWPLAMELTTGRHDLAARVLKRLVDAGDVFGGFRDEAPAIELDSVHQLEKLVDGAPLRRPWWFFDVRVQGSGAVDIPTHLVDRTQWLVDGIGVARAESPRLLSARAWPTRVPAEAFRRITGESEFPKELRPVVDGDALSYLCNAELAWQVGGVTARATTRWDLTPPAGGGDAARIAAHGRRADVILEQGAQTGHRRRLSVELRDQSAGVEALRDTVAAWQTELPGVGVTGAGPGRYEIAIPAALDAGHESHFTRVLDDFLTTIDEHRWPAALVARTLAKYTFLAEVAAATDVDDAVLARRAVDHDPVKENR